MIRHHEILKVVEGGKNEQDNIFRLLSRAENIYENETELFRQGELQPKDVDLDAFNLVHLNKIIDDHDNLNAQLEETEKKLDAARIPNYAPEISNDSLLSREAVLEDSLRNLLAKKIETEAELVELENELSTVQNEQDEMRSKLENLRSSLAVRSQIIKARWALSVSVMIILGYKFIVGGIS